MVVTEFTIMPSIPVDVLREILEHVRKADLPTLCRVNKIFCSCSQDVLYREIGFDDADVIETLIQSTNLAQRVRSFYYFGPCPKREMPRRNMSSLRKLNPRGGRGDASILDGCTFKLDSFTCSLPYSESLQKFLNSQPSLTNLCIFGDCDTFLPF